MGLQSRRVGPVAAIRSRSCMQTTYCNKIQIEFWSWTDPLLPPARPRNSSKRSLPFTKWVMNSTQELSSAAKSDGVIFVFSTNFCLAIIIYACIIYAMRTIRYLTPFGASRMLHEDSMVPILNFLTAPKRDLCVVRRKSKRVQWIHSMFYGYYELLIDRLQKYCSVAVQRVFEFSF